MDISEARLAIIASNANLTPAEVEERAQRFLAHDEEQKALAGFKAAAAEREQLDDEERARRRAVLNGDAEAEGPTYDDLLKKLRGMQEAGEGW
jgi:hypothetical protein